MAIKSVLVIGGSKGIGLALARHYSAQGIPVLTTSRVEPGERGIPWVQHDVANREFPPAVTRWLAAAPRGRLVLQTAATFGPVGPIQSVDLDQWARAIEVNVTGTARTLQAAVPLLTSQDRVVAFLGGGIGGPNMQPRATAYTTSKIAVAGLIEAVADDAGCRVPVIGVSPGAFPTDFTAAVLETPPEIAGAELIKQVQSVRSSDFDISRLVEVLDAIAGYAGERLGGRIISAQRDDPLSAAEAVNQSPELFRLRRVDGFSIVAGKRW